MRPLCAERPALARPGAALPAPRGDSGGEPPSGRVGKPCCAPSRGSMQRQRLVSRVTGFLAIGAAGRRHSAVTPLSPTSPNTANTIPNIGYDISAFGRCAHRRSRSRLLIRDPARPLGESNGTIFDSGCFTVPARPALKAPLESRPRRWPLACRWLITMFGGKVHPDPKHRVAVPCFPAVLPLPQSSFLMLSRAVDSGLALQLARPVRRTDVDPVPQPHRGDRGAGRLHGDHRTADLHPETSPLRRSTFLASCHPRGVAGQAPSARIPSMRRPLGFNLPARGFSISGRVELTHMWGMASLDTDLWWLAPAGGPARLPPTWPTLPATQGDARATWPAASA